jgi:very-short-patch-repair endonuclease
MGDKVDPCDVVIARIAGRQHGVVTHRQLVDTGLSRAAISKRARSGRLHRIHRGVYAVGHCRLSVEGRWMAAVLACGEGAVLSHGSAAALWGLLRPISGSIDVSVPTHAGLQARAGIRLHRCVSLAKVGWDQPRRITVRNSIPVTTPARTIEDLRPAVPPRLLRRAIRQAEVAGLRLGPQVGADRTRSDLERDFLRLCRHYRLPAPEVNVRVGRWTVDFLWRRQRLAVETDSLRYHGGSVAFEDDHARDLDLRARGFDVRRFTAHQVRDASAQVATDLRDALAPAS